MSGYYHMPLEGQYDQHAEPSAFRPSRAEDWEPYRDIIAHLYNTMKLKDVMTEMQMTYNFKATEKQYKTQLKKWNLDTKYIKASEYMAMLQIMREREAQDPSKQTRFILRGRPVDPKDIARFEKRHQKKGTLKEGDLAELQGRRDFLRLQHDQQLTPPLQNLSKTSFITPHLQSQQAMYTHQPPIMDQAPRMQPHPHTMLPPSMPTATACDTIDTFATIPVVFFGIFLTTICKSQPADGAFPYVSYFDQEAFFYT
ncbi:Clr5 domain-containing protein [Triangularia verruculosa]|uniref:Clr5 domain-containing protein n=1 Tax=Triangularia verruculosa TaxID=2587418 RepID=A0AAN7AWW3_9PEZI|nr:Clr5 domain-containing protein [Triangularia verruculosa]